MFINFTNHPKSLWQDKQIKEAEKYGEIVDMPFPVVNSKATEKEILQLAEEYKNKIIELSPKAVLCQGEMTLLYAIVSKLIAEGIEVMAACSERISSETKDEDGNVIKTSRFEFEKFRRYVGE